MPIDIETEQKQIKVMTLQGIKYALQLMRPQQWTKNIFIFVPLFFSSRIHEVQYVIPTIFAFLSFCMVASSIYCFNDIHDADADRLHPTKCLRPIAAGHVSKGGGYLIMAFCFLSAIALTFAIGIDKLSHALTIILAYWVLNIFYCVKLKQVAILDVTCIAVGFLMRVMMGGVAADARASQWLIMMTFLLTLFLALSKRYDDVLLNVEEGKVMRKSITGYDVYFISVVMAVVAAVTLVCYIMYTISDEVTARFGTNKIYLTSIWVICGLSRFLQLMIVFHKSSSPTRTIIYDRFMRACIIGWILSFFLIIYL